MDIESADDGGGARGDGDAQHHDQEDQVGPGVGLVEHLHRDQGEAGGDIHRARRVRPDQQQADGQGGQGGRGDGGAQQRGHEDQLSLEMGLEEQVHRDQDQGEAGGDEQRARRRGLPDQHHGDGPGGHGGEGEEQLPRVIVRKKFKMKDGIQRDGRLQLSIVNFISKSGRGAEGSNE